MSLFRRKDKSKDKDSGLPDLKPPKTKKAKINDIWAACEQGSLEALEKILKKKNGIAQVNQAAEDGRWPIHIAAGGGHVELVELLLANGAQCNMIENTEARWNVLHHAVNSRNFQMMKLIASQPNLKPDFRGPSSGTSRMDRNSPLHHYARMFEDDNENIITTIVQQRGGNVNAVNSQGETPLHVACTYKHLEIAQELIKNGATPNAQNDHGETPLHLGARYGPEGMVKLLLGAGGNPTIVGANGTPLEVSTSVAIKKLLNSSLQSYSAAQPSSSASSAPSAKYGAAYGASSAASKMEKGISTKNLNASDLDSSVSSSANERPPLQRMASKKYHWTVDYSEIIMGSQIGSGGFGVVFKGVWRGINVAVKCLKHVENVNEDELAVFLHEVNVMSRLRHQNILLFVGACLDMPHICFLTEYIPHGNLRTVLDKERLLPLKKLNMAIEATRGLAYLHSQTPAVLHRDLKSANVLVDDNYHIKLADFGLSRAASIHAGEAGSHESVAALLEKAIAIRYGNNPYTNNGNNGNNINNINNNGNNNKESINTAQTSISNGDSANATDAGESAQSTTTTIDASQEAQSNTITTQESKNKKTEEKKSEEAAESQDGPAFESSSSADEARKTNSSSASAPQAASQPGYLDLLDQAGTLYTTAPEVLTGAEYSREADVYALGIIFWELATEKIPYDGLPHLQLVREIVERSLPVPTEMGTAFGSLIRDMLSKDPAARPTLLQIQERLKECRAELGEKR